MAFTKGGKPVVVFSGQIMFIQFLWISYSLQQIEQSLENLSFFRVSLSDPKM